MIHGGYYIKARQIQNSRIATASPCTREIWDWLLMQANHKTTKTCARGQCIRSYKDIQEGLKWYVGYRKKTYSKWSCEAAMKLLTKLAMITTTKTTRGMLISICNYDTYQNPANYEDHNGNHNEDHNKTTVTPHYKQECKNDKNDKNDKKQARTPQKRFAKPSIDEIRVYAKSIDYDLDAEVFFDHYESNGWVVGRTRMKNWKAAVRTWRKNKFAGKKPKRDLSMDFDDG